MNGFGKIENIKGGFTLANVIQIIIYIMIVGIAWGILQSSVSENRKQSTENKVEIKEMKTISVQAQIDIATLSTKIDNLIEQQKILVKSLEEK
ncbi:hypothetical protein KKH23_06405 [Patescibacteria group bacterium]|uniref:Uncharacterized protein n=1 Tax=viral metagenome TaxID=1070528 RepID=A0A6M3MG86_9ZZZZ|nr:hypothetical protein [Patescibacteria group bacterium]MBU0846806.1 hypothetical protein [Patescibacteria group bacterium]MBU1067838.1 hypothetical protein [Patescibacteria group bacterium]